MKLSTRMRYGTRALVEIAAGYPHSVVSVKDIAARQGISASYLEQIMGPLKAAGLVRSVRGLHGGYSLTAPPSACRLSDIYATLEGSAAPVACVDEPESCAFRDSCPTRETWEEMKQSVLDVLERTTLQDLLERARRKQQGRAYTYHI